MGPRLAEQREAASTCKWQQLFKLDNARQRGLQHRCELLLQPCGRWTHRGQQRRDGRYSKAQSNMCMRPVRLPASSGHCRPCLHCLHISRSEHLGPRPGLRPRKLTRHLACATWWRPAGGAAQCLAAASLSALSAVWPPLTSLCRGPLIGADGHARWGRQQSHLSQLMCKTQSC